MIELNDSAPIVSHLEHCLKADKMTHTSFLPCLYLIRVAHGSVVARRICYGVFSAAAKITVVLSNSIAKEIHSPNSAHSIVTEIIHLKGCLAQFFPFLKPREAASRSKRTTIPLELIIIMSTSCVTTPSDLEKFLDRFKLDQHLSQMKELRWALQDQKKTP